jgi:tRNA pseudouridine38-40 synthase
MNDELPAEINILDATIVPHRFHARHDAAARAYLYQIARRRTALAKPFVWWIKDALDIDRMREAAGAFVGMRDFASFADSDGDDDPSGRSKKSTLVLVERLDLVEEGDLVLVGIEGSHFLWKMVRRIVGVLAEVGRGRLSADAAAEMLRGGSAAAARLTAPASGLFLNRVYYEGEARQTELRAVTPLRAVVSVHPGGKGRKGGSGRT